MPVHHPVGSQRRPRRQCRVCGHCGQTPGQRQPGCAAQQRQQYSLRHHLPHQPGAARAYAQPNRQLFAPSRAPRQRHGRQIQARNRCHNRHQRYEKPEHLRPQVARNLRQRPRSHQHHPLRLARLRGRQRIVLIQPPRNPIQRRFRRIDRDPWRKPHQHLEILRGRAGAAHRRQLRSQRRRHRDRHKQLRRNGLSAPSNFLGVTPTIVAFCPFSFTVCPIAPGSAFIRLRQNRSLITTAGVPPVLSRSAFSSRPLCASIPSTEK